MSSDVLVRRLGTRDYRPVWAAMREFTEQRDAQTPDELWVVEHTPVYTLGLNGKREHLLEPHGEGDRDAIPVIPVDRGGQVTYHGPGQVVIYLLLDLRRRGFGVRDLVERMELAVLDLLAEHGLQGERRRDAPGVYVNGAKLAALGLRVRRGCSYHGLALNVGMDLAPFTRINPCGYANLAVTQLADLTALEHTRPPAERLLVHLQARLQN